MTNRQLIELLAIHDDDAEVVIEVGRLRNDEQYFTVRGVAATTGQTGAHDAVLLTLAYR